MHQYQERITKYIEIGRVDSIYLYFVFTIKKA